MLSTMPSACGFNDGASAWTSSGTANHTQASHMGKRFNLILPFQRAVIDSLLPRATFCLGYRCPRVRGASDEHTATTLALRLIRLACLRKSSSPEPDAAHRFCCEQ